MSTFVMTNIDKMTNIFDQGALPPETPVLAGTRQTRKPVSQYQKSAWFLLRNAARRLTDSLTNAPPRRGR